ncbi:hypothetical protein QJQ45_026719, partial [Haematococcus lacustris]
QPCTLATPATMQQHSARAQQQCVPVAKYIREYDTYTHPHVRLVRIRHKVFAHTWCRARLPERALFVLSCPILCCPVGSSLTPRSRTSKLLATAVLERFPRIQLTYPAQHDVLGQDLRELAPFLTKMLQDRQQPTEVLQIRQPPKLHLTLRPARGLTIAIQQRQNAEPAAAASEAMRCLVARMLGAVPLCGAVDSLTISWHEDLHLPWEPVFSATLAAFFPSLTSLTFSDVRLSIGDLAKAISHPLLLPRLKHLDIMGARITHEGDLGMSPYIGSRLERLSLCGWVVQDVEHVVLPVLEPLPPTLTKLEVGGMGNGDQGVWSTLAAAVRSLTQLQELLLTNDCNTIGPEFMELLLALAHLPNLHTLSIDGYVRGQEQLDALLALTQITRLELWAISGLTSGASAACSWRQLDVTRLHWVSAAYLPLHSLTHPLRLHKVVMDAKDPSIEVLAAAELNLCERNQAGLEMIVDMCLRKATVDLLTEHYLSHSRRTAQQPTHPTVASSSHSGPSTSLASSSSPEGHIMAGGPGSSSGQGVSAAGGQALMQRLGRCVKVLRILVPGLGEARLSSANLQALPVLFPVADIVFTLMLVGRTLTVSSGPATGVELARQLEWQVEWSVIVLKLIVFAFCNDDVGLMDKSSEDEVITDNRLQGLHGLPPELLDAVLRQLDASSRRQVFRTSKLLATALLRVVPRIKLRYPTQHDIMGQHLRELAPFLTEVLQKRQHPKLRLTLEPASSLTDAIQRRGEAEPAAAAADAACLTAWTLGAVPLCGAVDCLTISWYGHLVLPWEPAFSTALAASFPSLTSLTFYEGRMSIGHLANAINPLLLSKLVHLDINGITITHKGQLGRSPFIGSRLQTLSLQDVVEVDGERELLFGLLPLPPTLTQLAVSGSLADRWDWVRIAAAVSSLTQLQQLRLTDGKKFWYKGGPGPMALLSALAHLPSLHTLEVDEYLVGQDQLDALLALTQITRLELFEFTCLTSSRASAACSWRQLDVKILDWVTAAFLPLHSLTHPLRLQQLHLTQLVGDIEEPSVEVLAAAELNLCERNKAGLARNVSFCLSKANVDLLTEQYLSHSCRAAQQPTHPTVASSSSPEGHITPGGQGSSIGQGGQQGSAAGAHPLMQRLGRNVKAVRIKEQGQSKDCLSSANQQALGVLFPNADVSFVPMWPNPLVSASYNYSVTGVATPLLEDIQ